MLTTSLNDAALIEDRIVTLLDAAERTSCSVAPLKRAAKRGELRIIKLSPRRVGVRLRDLRSFMEGRVS